MNEPHSLCKVRSFTEARATGAVFRVIVAFGLALTLGCSQRTTASRIVTLATTTSTQDSGLLDNLLPDFRQQTGIEVKVVAAGTGQALELGRRGDADVLLTHAPAVEEKFMAEGFGSERHPVMYNDFVLAGPRVDPAGIQGKPSVVEAFRQIAQAGSRFISRGDESGTHQKEREIWMKLGVEPKGSWYMQAGSGMAQALRMAQEKHAYLLTDRATFLALRKELDLAILVQGDALLRNRYVVIVVNPQKHPHVRHDAARQFAGFLVSAESQRKIADFGKDKYGEAMFFPDADSLRK
jgi:tungstate transport system substrate-binding protein